MLYMERPWDVEYVARVLAEIMSRESGQKVTITLVPKDKKDQNTNESA